MGGNSAAAGVLVGGDDEEVILGMAQSVLDQAGYDVLSACNGHEALEIYAAQSGRIDAVVLDMTMPVMDGEETMQRLADRWPGAAIIATSGYDLQEAERRFAHAAGRFPPEALHRKSVDVQGRGSGPSALLVPQPPNSTAMVVVTSIATSSRVAG